MEAQPPPGYNATFDETHLGRQLTRPGKKGSSPSKVFKTRSSKVFTTRSCGALVDTMLQNERFTGP